ncbi:sensor histidine kinase [Eubacterium ventriosum]|uniref:ATPase/histidine kinase/DNA gyrase B/HSP90 domain protein n=1 Tax=Eubacterium ventriosum ATCC 27560 TaxID=411463 RepID=A5ZAE5_9FIRM|nr:sensor histidine kinase [Eubacterium ventriosum]EDM50046.1 ATPase/histidine kinase/DNA gyrase B/HSP90 domain protein [Eubacterium ventriosum ATCC 27560]UWP35529.1 GHKL domain-containing protein [Eubacterium ventriosum]
MSNFWLITNVFLDVFPWIFLLYMPFKDRLRFSVITTGVLNYIALTIYLLIFKKITTAEFYNLDVMFSYRVVQIFVVLTLVIFLVDDYIEKSLFVYGLLLPISVVILVWASHINNYITIRQSATYLDTAVLRIIISAICFPFMYILWKKYIVPVVKTDNRRQWRQAWIIPIIFSIVSLAYCENNFEITYMRFNQVIARFTLSIGVVIVSVMQFSNMNTEEKFVRAEEKAKRSKMLIDMKSEQYNMITEKIEKTRKSRHDIHHHINVVYQLAKENKIEQLIEYLEEYNKIYSTKEPMVYCNNSTVDAILNHYILLAKDNGIEVHLNVALPEELKIRDTDLCIVIGNLLENAIEASEKEENKRIKLRINRSNEYICMLVSNLYNGEIKKGHSGYYSRKREFKDTGIGLSSVSAVVEKYDGRMEVDHTNGEFNVFIMMANISSNLT